MLKDEVTNDNYLCEAVSGKYYTIYKDKLKRQRKEDFIKENRLSQVFSATFNSSKQFQSVFLKFIKYSKKVNSSLIAKTQVHFKPIKESYYIDILILEKKGREVGKPLITIENKIELQLQEFQFINYNKINALKNTTKVTIVKHKYDKDKYKNLDWKIFRWSDFYEELSTKTYKGIDRFLIINFLNFLEKNNLAIKHTIEEKELLNLAKAIDIIRNKDKSFGFNLIKLPFHVTIGDYLNMLEEIYKEAKTINLFSKKIDSKVFNPIIGYVPRNKDKRDDFWIGVEMGLKHHISKNKIMLIGAGIEFSNKEKPKYKIVTYATHTDDDYGKSEKKSYPKGDLRFEKYKKHVLSCWETWLKGDIFKKTK